MKKILAVTLVAALLLAGCSAAGGAVKLGLGEKTMIDSSTDLTETDGVKAGNAQVDTMMCAVLVDESGKVVSIHFDTAQTKVAFDEAGKITSDKTVEYPTKRERGDDYGMKKASSIGKEWYEQVDAIEKWMTGKTSDEIKGMKTKETDEGAVSDEADLTSSATIGISEFLEVAAEAIANAK